MLSIELRVSEAFAGRVLSVLDCVDRSLLDEHDQVGGGATVDDYGAVRKVFENAARAFAKRAEAARIEHALRTNRD